MSFSSPEKTPTKASPKLDSAQSKTNKTPNLLAIAPPQHLRKPLQVPTGAAVNLRYLHEQHYSPRKAPPVRRQFPTSKQTARAESSSVPTECWTFASPGVLLSK